MKINPKAPAYPGQYEVDGESKVNGGPWAPSKIKVLGEGIPIRLAIAAQVLSGLLANNTDGPVRKADGVVCVTMGEVEARMTEISFEYADALIAAYNEGEK